MNLYFMIQLISIFCNFEAHATVATCHVTGRGGGELGHLHWRDTGYQLPDTGTYKILDTTGVIPILDTTLIRTTWMD
jgi:hypothetical protein